MRNFHLILLLFLFACQTNYTSEESDNADLYPAAQGFNQEGSDQKAIDLADEVMRAQGGKKAWDEVRYISWSFFGRRNLLWDKHKGNVRIESPGDSMVYLVNIFDKTGKAFRDGQEISDPEELNPLLQRGYEIWVNDSYWLCMPFKLKDTGVTLNYLREGTTQSGIDADVIQLTFQNVGVTPQNKYEIWVDKSDKLIKQWAFFREASKDTADAIWPWDNYQEFGKLKLSSDRSDGRGPGDLKILETVDESLFQGF